MRIRKRIIFLILVVSSLSVGASVWLRRPSNEQLLLRAQRALDAAEYGQCEAYCREMLLRESPSPAILVMAGRAAAELGRHDEALDYFAHVPASERIQSMIALRQSVNILLELGRLRQAELLLQQLLTAAPMDVAANRELSKLLVMQGRLWESRRHHLKMVEMGTYSTVTLLLAGNGGHPSLVYDSVPRLQRLNPDDPGVLMAIFAIDREDGRLDALLRQLRRIVAMDSGFVAAQAELGLLLAESAPLDQVVEWERQLPNEADRHPNIWAARGLWARRLNQHEAAARCFWEAVRRDAQNELASYHLSQTLSVLGRDEEATSFASRTDSLSELRLAFHNLYKNPHSLVDIRKAQSHCEALGRHSESAAWCRVALQMQPNLPWANAALTRESDRLAHTRPTDPGTDNPALRMDLSDLALPVWPNKRDESLSAKQAVPTHVRFRDVAGEAGLHFQYFESEDSSTPGKRMFELTGGGAAILDYDLDGWPDIHLTQGTSWPPDDSNDEHYDQLFRNQGDGSFAKITRSAGVDDVSYSQGVAVGDFNSDGFPDLYVANIGRNRLYRNNGDGTFTDVSEGGGITSDRWTTSCVLVDLNGDALPDVYDVNYLRGDDVFSRICEDNGIHHACFPTDFDAEQDQFFLNAGDGRFVDMTARAGFVTANGTGLGVVAADFDDQRSLSLFVANDAKPNFFFRNRTPQQTPSRPAFAESAVVAGLAYDQAGRPQACMGVATGDVDGDGRLDLFVTNFYMESNTLYLQQETGVFIDATRRFGLRDSSISLLGFGTQMVDGELDGWPDLVIANGHVEDYSIIDGPYRMQPQYFRNNGSGRFEEVDSRALGPYFQGTYLGRGLARLDWNRDGREDIVVSHIDAPVALLTNECESAGHFVAVQLRGVESSRDAIGAIVTVSTENRTWTRQLTAGDGYMASNERRLVFGLGKTDAIDALTVEWPTGKKETFANLSSDTEILVVEGRHPSLWFLR